MYIEIVPNMELSKIKLYNTKNKLIKKTYACKLLLIFKALGFLCNEHKRTTTKF